jgi:ribosomal protein S17E
MEVPRMNNQLIEEKKPDHAKTNWVRTDVREGLQNLLENEVRAMVIEELKKGTQEILEEQRKVIKQSMEENKTTIQQITEEEKKAVWDNLDNIRKSIIKVTF